MTDVVEAAGFIVFTRTLPERFLLMKHINRWDLPKGHAEANEAILDTAMRETEEETGIDVATLQVDPEFRFVTEYPLRSSKRGEYIKRVTIFLGTIPAPVDIQLTEHIGFEWFAWPTSKSIQAATIDPLLAAVAKHRELQAEV